MDLFSLLDTVADRPEDPWEDLWQRRMWVELSELGWIKDPARTRTYSPILARWAPRATAMVQIVRTDDDLRRVSLYLAKEVPRHGSDLMAWRNSSIADFNIRELSEFHSSLGVHEPARLYRKDPKTGTKVLNLDEPLRWKVGRKVI